MITTTARSRALDQSRRTHAATEHRLGRIVLASLVAGLVVAAALPVLAPVPARRNILVGLGLLGAALGWALLVFGSVRFSDQPQRWAIAPAAFLALAGITSLGGMTALQAVLGWVWPPALLALVVWMTRQVRRLPSQLGRWLLYPVLAALAISSVCGGYETVRERLDARAHPVPGQLVDVGGHRLHLQCTGTGSPTVVLEPGLGGTSSDLGWIAPRVARTSRVCVYDRAGRGGSDPTDGPQDAQHIAADLHALLTRADVPGPYVLAGHSFGGLYVLSFAAQFPDQVAGLVLLDSTAPGPGPDLTTGTETDPVVARVSAILPAVAHLGVGRLLAVSSYGTLPRESQSAARANSSTARHLASVMDELLAGSASARQAAAMTSLGDKPLIVLTADTGHDSTWRSAQDDLATLATNSQLRVAKATTHQSLVDDEADSAAASRAIVDVVDSVRSLTPLTLR